ncbi:hypothetical protein MVEN_00818000 [Mycena venus]|uniref:Uncharacterized protein n=1 Tax=Mycena venus TaxID=2733690 RepID=A0A8H6YFF7_9AGAR|nr:hypothetical protein MVEN_00818000 [Mycena venus]
MRLRSAFLLPTSNSLCEGPFSRRFFFKLVPAMATPNPPTFISSSGHKVMYLSIGLVVQTFFFGMYTILNFMSIRMLLQRGLKTKVHKILFSITTFMYLLSAAFWAYSIAYTVGRMESFIKIAANEWDFSTRVDAVLKWSPLFNAIIFINYVLSDGIVVWRAWVICMRSHRRFMCIPIFFLGLTTISVLLTIAFRIANFDHDIMPHLADYLNFTQVTAVATSLISNLSSMSIVGATLWRHWRTIHAAFPEKKRPTRANRTMIVIVESGVLYSLSTITLVLFSAIPSHLPSGSTFGDLYTPINVQIAGAYPSIVLLLVSAHGSLNDSTFSDDDFSVNVPTASIRFAPNPVIAITAPDDLGFMEDSQHVSRRWSDSTVV